MKLKITDKEKKDILEQYQDEKILSIPGFFFFNDDWNLLMSFLNKRGNPKWKMMGNLELSRNKDVTTLNNLVSVEGYLDLYGSPITTLENLQSVGGYLDLRYSKIESLGNLQSVVGGGLYLIGTPLTTLGNLQSVGGDLYLRGTPITSLGNLESVGGWFNLRETPISKKYTKEEIRQMVNVGGSIHI